MKLTKDEFFSLLENGEINNFSINGVRYSASNSNKNIVDKTWLRIYDNLIKIKFGNMNISKSQIPSILDEIRKSNNKVMSLLKKLKKSYMTVSDIKKFSTNTFKNFGHGYYPCLIASKLMNNRGTIAKEIVEKYKNVKSDILEECKILLNSIYMDQLTLTDIVKSKRNKNKLTALYIVWGYLFKKYKDIIEIKSPY